MHNWDVLGHEWVVDLLRQHVSQERLRHAYLLTGPQGVGRRTLALRLAQAVNCLQPPMPGQPCAACRACTQIARQQHPDLALVQAEQIGGVLKVDQVRELQHSLALAPYEARYRVALLLRFEEAHLSAANALLKTLEEPPPKALLILTAESAESLLPTIVSRCEVLRLRPLSLESAAHGLQVRWALTPERARLLAHISGGRPGYAISLHEQPEQWEQRQAWLDDHRRLLAASRVERFAFAEEMTKDKVKDKMRDNLLQMLQVWLSLWRDVLLRASGAAAPAANLDREAEIAHLAGRVGLSGAHKIIGVLERTQELIEHNVNPRLAVEVLLLDLPQIA